MIDRQKLTDATLQDWQLLDDGKLAWYEGDHDLEVRVWETKAGGGKAVAVAHKNANWHITLDKDWRKWIEVAYHYAQFCDRLDSDRGSEEEFWHYAKAYEVFGTEPMFGGTADGIYCHVGPDDVFCEYTDGRYNLFDQGLHTYAGTPAALTKAYEKLIREIKLWAPRD